jgi:diaminopimelate decarboxylase/aspartate kinase
MSASLSPQFLVLKFGGTSVAKKERWEAIGEIAAARMREGFKPVVVCSAVSGVSNALEAIIRKIASGEDFKSGFDAIMQTHRNLAADLNVDFAEHLGADFAKLEQKLLGASLVQEVSPRIHAHVMSFGEILATRLGAAYLNKSGLNVAWYDAREALLANHGAHTNEQRQYLSASCSFESDAALQQTFGDLPVDVVLTQGFIARNASGQTVLLGRGGSDTSASYFAAKLGAARCEIWTDVPGMYTANPRQIPQARILNQLDYEEAQEIATMGAKVLHPRCIAPVHHAHIPLHIRCTNAPEMPGTVISDTVSTGPTHVKSISTKTNITLVSVETLGMWQEVGFLADLFTIFKQHGVSIDLVSTSETNVTVSIDPLSNALLPKTLDDLCKDLGRFGSVKRIAPCTAVSLVGRNIRSILYQLGPALQVFEEQKVYMMSQAASDLNLTFVVQEDEADRLVGQLHHLLFDSMGAHPTFGPSWQDTFERKPPRNADTQPPWWQDKSEELLQLAAAQSPLYVYNASTLKASAQVLLSLDAITRVFYAVKANDNASILKTFYDCGIGFECVSIGELNYIFELFTQIDPKRILFTPNFAPRVEYEKALLTGCQLTLDNLYPLENWPELFQNQNIFLRLDPGQGRGHHNHVQTAGEQSKFGIARHEIGRAMELTQKVGARVIGLHSHAGSGIAQPSHWVEMAALLMEMAKHFPDVKVLNLGGGLFVPSQINDDALDLEQINAGLRVLKTSHPNYELWLEPGRFLVANSGVLLTRVTQLKEKAHSRFVGVDTGMNSLIRPALYGSYHHIVNLSRLNETADQTAHVVGPICESGDTLGYDRKLPKTFEGDVLLIATAGAYGHVMGSNYNRRPVANEHFLA